MKGACTLIWLGRERLHWLDADGKLHSAPDLVVEVLSLGQANAERDRPAKRAQYERCGVAEYWIVDRFARQVAVYRHAEGRLALVEQVPAAAELMSPRLPGFAGRMGALFAIEPEPAPGSPWFDAGRSGQV